MIVVCAAGARLLLARVFPQQQVPFSAAERSPETLLEHLGCLSTLSFHHAHGSQHDLKTALAPTPRARARRRTPSESRLALACAAVRPAGPRCSLALVSAAAARRPPRERMTPLTPCCTRAPHAHRTAPHARVHVHLRSIGLFRADEADEADEPGGEKPPPAGACFRVVDAGYTPVVGFYGVDPACPTHNGVALFKQLRPPRVQAQARTHGGAAAAGAWVCHKPGEGGETAGARALLWNSDSGRWVFANFGGDGDADGCDVPYMSKEAQARGVHGAKDPEPPAAAAGWARFGSCGVGPKPTIKWLRGDDRA